MSPTPTPSPSPAPVFKEDEGFSQPLHDAIPLEPGHPCINSGSARCILDHQQKVADELNATSTSTMTPSEFNALMDGQPSHNTAAPVIAGVVLSVLVLVAGAVAFIRHRRVTSPAPAPAEATP